MIKSEFILKMLAHFTTGAATKNLSLADALQVAEMTWTSRDALGKGASDDGGSGDGFFSKCKPGCGCPNCNPANRTPSTKIIKANALKMQLDLDKAKKGMSPAEQEAFERENKLGQWSDLRVGG